MKKVLKSFFLRHGSLIAGAFLSLITIFLAICVVSYHPTDNSWLYYSTKASPVFNKMGWLGAYISSLLFYLIGSGVFFLLMLLFFISGNLLLNQSLKKEWDRCLAFIVVITSVSTYSALMHTDLIVGITPGGLLGNALAIKSVQFLDSFLMYLLIFVLLLASSIIILRFSFISLVHYMLKGVKYILSWDRFILPAYNAIKVGVTGIVKGVTITCSYFKKVFNGTFAPKQYIPCRFSYDYEEVDTRELAHDFNRLLNKSKKVKRRSCPIPSLSKISVTDYSEEKVYEDTYSPEYSLPDLDVFIGRKDEKDDPVVLEELENRARTLEEKLERFGVYGKVISIKRGPVVTLFEYRPQIDSKISKIISLEDDLALALQALSIRIIAPIPGRSVVGFEVANKKRKDVLFAKVIQTSDFHESTYSLPLILGEDTIGNNIVVDLAKMPHLLIAGSTGSGKSVALNSMLVSLLCKCSPQELKLILIDPKRLEFASYADIAHLVFPIVTHPKKAAYALKWVVKQMEERYEKMAEHGARNIFDYRKKNPEDKLPFIVVVIDELSDLMMLAGKEIEDLITRITQMARAAGIHMIVATQRPSVDVITGLIKVNFPSRISFRVTSKIDSRTILDCSGADKLLGRGDMLFLDSSSSCLKRVHGAYVSDKEIRTIVSHIHRESRVNYLEMPEEQQPVAGLSQADDKLYKDVVCFLETVEEVSISLLQRKFKIGYNRSARIIDTLECDGLISSADGGKTRKVIRQ